MKPLRKMLAVLIVISALSILLSIPTQAAWNMPPGAFLKDRAATVGDLTKQISNDSTVRMRYARHFKIAPSELAERFNGELKLVSLKHPLRTTMWYIDKNGNIYKKGRLLPKGTMVFAAKNGKPVLAWACGNPLSASLPAAKVHDKTAVKASTEIIAAAKPAPIESVETKVLASPVETIAIAAVTAMPTIMTEAVVVEPVAAVQMMGSPSLAALPPLISRGSSLGWIGALSGLAGGAAALASRGDGGEKSNFVTPEPSSFAAVATALSAFGIIRQKRRKLSQNK